MLMSSVVSRPCASGYPPHAETKTGLEGGIRPSLHGGSTMDTYKKVGIVGTGVIGASWTTDFLARGLDVYATDPAGGAEERLRSLVAQQWHGAMALGLADGASLERLHFSPNLERTLADVDFVQESGPERVEIKRSLFATLDEVVPHHVILASSSSGIPATEFQAACKHPERVLIGHPFNPPHLIPLVEVVGGERTSPQAVETALEFYRLLGKKPIHIRKEIKGFVANRLQAALLREAFGLVQAGIASAADVDAVIANGPGLRWAILGPFANFHLSGGAGGMEHVLEHLGPSVDEWWQDLFPTRMTEKTKATVLSSAKDETDDWDIDEVIRERDKLLVSLIRGKATFKHIP